MITVILKIIITTLINDNSNTKDNNNKSKELQPIRSMITDTGSKTINHEEWASLIEHQFKTLWKCGNAHLLDL